MFVVHIFAATQKIRFTVMNRFMYMCIFISPPKGFSQTDNEKVICSISHVTEFLLSMFFNKKSLRWYKKGESIKIIYYVPTPIF